MQKPTIKKTPPSSLCGKRKANKQPEKSRSLSDCCFIVLFWALIVVHLWKYKFIFLMLPLLLVCFGIKRIGMFFFLYFVLVINLTDFKHFTDKNYRLILKKISAECMIRKITLPPTPTLYLWTEKLNFQNPNLWENLPSDITSSPIHLVKVIHST